MLLFSRQFFPFPPHSFLHFITSGSLRTGYENKGPFVPLRTALYNFFFLPNYVSSSHSGNEFPSPPSSKRKGGNPPALPPPPVPIGSFPLSLKDLLSFFFSLRRQRHKSILSSAHPFLHLSPIGHCPAVTHINSKN